MNNPSAFEDKSETAKPRSQLVEMNWDPITRIVGSLGIYTKIDFAIGRWPNAAAPPRYFAAIAYS